MISWWPSELQRKWMSLIMQVTLANFPLTEWRISDNICGMFGKWRKPLNHMFLNSDITSIIFLITASILMRWHEPLSLCRPVRQEPQHTASATSHMWSHRRFQAWGLLKHSLVLPHRWLTEYLLALKLLFNHLFLSPLTQREFYIKEVSFCNVYLTTYYAKVISSYSRFICCLIAHWMVGVWLWECFKWFALFLLMMFSQNVIFLQRKVFASQY